MNMVMTRGVCGLLGANGAGKTTLMRMICGIMVPSDGEILWNGKRIQDLDEQYRKILGYLPQEFGYYPEFSAVDYLLYIAALKGLKPLYAKNACRNFWNWSTYGVPEKRR